MKKSTVQSTLLVQIVLDDLHWEKSKVKHIYMQQHKQWEMEVSMTSDAIEDGDVIAAEERNRV